MKTRLAILLSIIVVASWAIVYNVGVRAQMHAPDTIFALVDAQSANVTQVVGRLRGYVYIRIGGELLLMPVYTLPGDDRVFRIEHRP